VGPKSDMVIEDFVRETSLGLGCCSYQRIELVKTMLDFDEVKV
jgi:hypothetical protein